jgi:hypothetical protein
MSNNANMSRDEFAALVRKNAEYFTNEGKKMLEIGTFLTRAQDAGPALFDDLFKLANRADEIKSKAKESLSVIAAREKTFHLERLQLLKKVDDISELPDQNKKRVNRSPEECAAAVENVRSIVVAAGPDGILAKDLKGISTDDRRNAIRRKAIRAEGVGMHTRYFAVDNIFDFISK